MGSASCQSPRLSQDDKPHGLFLTRWVLLSCLYQRNEALSDRVACPSVWGCFKSVEVRPFPLGGKGGTERRLVHLKCLSRQGPSPGFARPLQVVRSPSVRGGHSPSPGSIHLGVCAGGADPPSQGGEWAAIIPVVWRVLCDSVSPLSIYLLQFLLL